MKKLANFRPITLIAVAVVFAIVSAYFFFIEKMEAVGAIIAAVVFLAFIAIPLLLCVNKKEGLKTALVFSTVVLLFCGFVFVRFYSVSTEYEKADYGDVYVSVIGRVERVEFMSSGKSLVIGDVEMSGRLSGKSGYKIFANYYGNGVDVGDVVGFSAVLQDKALKYEGRFCAADVNSGIKYFVSLSNTDITVKKSSPTVFESINVAIRDVLRLNLNEGEFAVSYALLCGNSDYSDANYLANYRNAGVAHVFAVSGLHIGFLAVVLGFLFSKLKLNPYISALITFAVLLFYSGVCGFTASSIRATIMCVVALTVKAYGGRYDGLTSLSIAAIILLLIYPVQLFCAGFVLSFCVVLGIITLSKAISRVFAFLPDFLAYSLGTVIAAELFSAPVLVAFFGEFSLFAILANLVFIPLVGVVYVFLILSVILALVFSPAVFLFLPNYVLLVLNTVINAFDYEAFIVGGITLTAITFLYYLALIIFSGLINVKRTVKIILSTVLTVIFAVCTAVISVKENNTVKAYAMGSFYSCMTVIESGKERAVIVSSATKGFSISRIERLCAKNGEKHTSVIIPVGVDANLVTTRLNAFLKIRSVYFYGDAENESVLENSFKNTDFVSVGGESIEFLTFDVKYSEKGRGVDVFAGKRTARIFAAFGDAADFEGAGDFDLIVAADYTDRVFAKYVGKVFVSYRNSAIYNDAERSGNFVFKFS